MSPLLKLDSNPNGKKVDVTLYRKMIASLLYLTTSRLNIMLSLCLCARYQADSKESHFLAIKRIMQYLVSTPHLGLWYPKSNTCSLLSYLHVDFIGSRTDRKRTMRGCQFFVHSLVS